MILFDFISYIDSLPAIVGNCDCVAIDCITVLCFSCVSFFSIVRLEILMQDCCMLGDCIWCCCHCGYATCPAYDVLTAQPFILFFCCPYQCHQPFCFGFGNKLKFNLNTGFLYNWHNRCNYNSVLFRLEITFSHFPNLLSFFAYSVFGVCGLDGLSHQSSPASS